MLKVIGPSHDDESFVEEVVVKRVPVVEVKRAVLVAVEVEVVEV